MDIQTFLGKYHLSLDDQQIEAVQTIRGPVLLLAVPGSGKTTVLVSRLGYLLENGAAPEQILTMTYTVAATADMRRRLASLFGEAIAERMEFRTIHSVCAKIIREYEQMRASAAFRLISEEGYLNAIVSERYREALDDFPTESDVKSMRTAITYAKNQMLKPDELEEMDQKLKGFSSVYQGYQDFLRERRLMDFDDQLVYALAILRRYPELLQSWKSRYRWICVDEAQDTSKIQHQIIALLSGAAGNLFMVGDEDQSIYGFRAAWPRALQTFELDHPGAKVLFLERNYRSTPQIVQKAGAFIRHNTQRRDKKMYAVRPDGPEVRRIETEYQSGQYRYLLQVARNCTRETAVLYRDNDCALPLIDLLERNGLPYRTRLLETGFFTCRVVRDVENIFRFAQDQTDGPKFLEIYYKLNLFLSQQEAHAAVKQCRTDQSILEYISNHPGISPFKRSQCRLMMTNMNQMLQDTAVRGLFRLKNHMGYGDYLEARGSGEQKYSILMALAANESTPFGLLRRLNTLHQLIQEGCGWPNANLILSTIHSSKGLEYDRVFLLDAVDGIFPARGAENDPEQMEEERRLYYVAMTRAKNDLNIFVPKASWITTSFSNLVFPEPSHGTASRIPTFTPPVSSAEESIKKDLIPGAAVLHRAFGRGVIVSRADDQAIIRFSDGIERHVLLSICLQQGLLRIDQKS